MYVIISYYSIKYNELYNNNLIYLIFLNDKICLLLKQYIQHNDTLFVFFIIVYCNHNPVINIIHISGRNEIQSGPLISE